MEVKIKQGANLIEATIEMVDGVMVVSPKEEKFEPKDGDVVVCEGFGSIQLFICKEYEDECCCFCYCFYDLEEESIVFDSSASYSVERFATEEEKQKLFDKLKEEGYEWKADTKELVKLKWKPKYNDNYWSPSLFDSVVVPWKTSWQDSKVGNKRLEKGWVFKTKEECQEFCNRLNDAINSVKP